MADHEADRNTRIVLAARPRGEPTADDFRLEHAPLPEPAHAARAHEGHGLAGASHWHASDVLGFILIAAVATGIVWWRGRK